MNEVSANQLIIETIGEELGHLSIDQLVVLINRYKNGALVETLLEEFDLNIKSTMLVRSFPLVRVDKCPNCPADLGCPIASKSSKVFLSSHKEECWNCGHKPYVLNCQCSVCISLKKQQEIEAEIKVQDKLKIKKETIKNEYGSENYKKVKESSLGLKEKIFLSIVVRNCLSEDGKYIKPIKYSLEPLTPSQELTTMLIRHLTSRKILIPSIDSDVDSFVFDEDYNTSSYYTYEVKYLLNIETEDKYSFLIERLLYPDIDIDVFYEDFLMVWNEVALHECLSYLLFQMNDVGYNFSIGETTKTTFEKLLEIFSVGQIYNLIFRAVSNSTRAYQSRNYTKTHAMNMVIASCRNQGEKAIAEKWDLKPYSRIKQLPESELSRLLFTTILKVPYAGFSVAPTLTNLSMLLEQ
ncbi:hypothetical protein ACFODO_04530 [Acinetobacter sichuanensis]|uniref:Uncharacterized protein n=1 Tax=Acinetobacter sichuanensis TaxID=2136183 RepID=A0A371YTP8_9GAMM|nr:hypothetical protein [Acinetobacter sichuanensis]RFC84842.1 hypothetical protein C9E89_004550 [Acinetobacter sichuanensis]